MSTIAIDVLSCDRDLSPFRDLWEDLYRRSPGEPSTSFEWSDALTRSHLEADDRLLLLGIRRDREIVGLSPLVVSRVRILGFPVALLTPLAERYNTHSELLTGAIDGGVVPALVAAIAQLEVRWDLFRMSRVPDAHPVVRLVERDLAQSMVSGHVRHGVPSYFLRLPGTFDDYLRGRSAKFRNHLRRVAKKIGGRGEVEVIEAVAPSDVARAYEHLLQVERASWKQTHGTAISCVPRQARFYRELCEGAAAAGRLHLQILTVAGEPAAYNLGYLVNGRYSYLKTSYAEPLKQLGAATFLRARLVEGLVASGVRELDFPAEPYEWERQWTETVRSHKVVSLYSATAVGRALACVDRLRHPASRTPQLEHADPRTLEPTPFEAVR